MPTASGQETKPVQNQAAAPNINGPVKKKKKNRIRPKRPKIAAKQANSREASLLQSTQDNSSDKVSNSVGVNTKILENLLSNSNTECESQNHKSLKLDNIKPTAADFSQIPIIEKMKEVAAVPEKSNGEPTTTKTREQVIAEREAKKLAKQAKKQKSGNQTVPSASTPESPDKMLKPEVMSPKPAATNAQPTVVPTSTTIHTAPAAANTPVTANSIPTPSASVSGEKSREQIKAEREAKKLLKQNIKASKQNVAADVAVELTQKMANLKLTPPAKAATATGPGTAKATVEEAATVTAAGTGTATATVTGTETQTAEGVEKKKPALTKAERRAIQEAQRAAKANAIAAKVKPVTGNAESNKATTKKVVPISTSQATAKQSITLMTGTKSSTSPVKVVKISDCNVKLFNHLVKPQKAVNLFVNNAQIHPIIARLGEQYAKRTVVGSNARCIAFLNALKIIIQDFVTPPKKEFSRSLEAFIKNCVDHLQNCRPLAVSVSNAYKHIKHVLTQLKGDQPETELKAYLCHFIDSYLENQIGKAALAISCSMQEKISNGDVILTFGCSSLINYIFEEAHRRDIHFRVIVVDSRPFCEGQELLRRLCAKEISCTYVLINAVSFVMPEVTKVLLGAHALLSNGYVMARTGTAQVALVARSCNVPVLVCCETHKFSERFQTDAIVYNELGNPDDLVLSDKCCLTNWQAKTKMSPLNLNYDITPPELVTAVVTEVSILPCTSVPVILRIKPTEIGYYN